MKIISVVGARPNFMKMAPLHKEIQKIRTQKTNSDLRHLICHTGQHYDAKMSKVFFDDLELPHPDFYLGVDSGSHAEQTAKIMMEFEKVLLKENPDLIIVYGDVNSTVACSLVAAKMEIKIAHVESGLRSFDRTMPEEINRIITDHLSDFLFVSENSGVENLKREGISEDKIFFVGNTMIDSLVHYLPKAEKSRILETFNLQQLNYILVTLHRPANVDSAENVKAMIEMLNNIIEASDKINQKRKIIFPVHPRTRINLQSLNIAIHPDLTLSDPIGYLDFIALMKNAELVVTDSGGIQEETTYIGVQCVTVRDNTERPVTVDIGTNHLAGTNLEKVEAVANSILCGKAKIGEIPEKWDGKAAERIIDLILEIINK